MMGLVCTSDWSGSGRQRQLGKALTQQIGRLGPVGQPFGLAGQQRLVGKRLVVVEAHGASRRDRCRLDARHEPIVGGRVGSSIRVDGRITRALVSEATHRDAVKGPSGKQRHIAVLFPFVLPVSFLIARASDRRPSLAMGGPCLDEAPLKCGGSFDKRHTSACESLAVPLKRGNETEPKREGETGGAERAGVESPLSHGAPTKSDRESVTIPAPRGRSWRVGVESPLYRSSSRHHQHCANRGTFWAQTCALFLRDGLGLSCRLHR